MKKKEREHLKEDPFQIFIENTLEVIGKFKKEILLGIGAVVALIVILLVVSFFRTGSISSDNEIYAAALEIQQSKTLKLDEKIKKLEEMEGKSGLSSDIQLMLGSLYFENGDLDKAKKIVKDFSGSKYKLIDDKKRLLEADLFIASSKNKEALDLLQKIYSDSKCEIAKDFLLLKLAKVQAKVDQKKVAVANLNKIKDEFPQSYYRYEAQTLLTKLEKK